MTRIRGSLKVQIDGVTIRKDTDSDTYREVFDLLYRKKIVKQEILSKLPQIVKDSQSAWRNTMNTHPHALTKITNSENLFINSNINKHRKKELLEQLFNSYNINGTVEIVDSTDEPIVQANDATEIDETLNIEIQDATSEETLTLEPVPVKNPFAQALCIIGDSGVGKSTRIQKTLKTAHHKALFVILDNMWQHILLDYSPSDRQYVPTKIGHFIKNAFEDKSNCYTIVIDECHKNLEIINDALLQAISLERNGGVRFLSLNSLIDKQFDYLPEENGNRLLPDNLGFVFVSSKNNIIEGNDDLKNRIKIVELTPTDREDETYSIGYLLSKIKKEEDGEYTD